MDGNALRFTGMRGTIQVLVPVVIVGVALSTGNGWGASLDIDSFSVEAQVNTRQANPNGVQSVSRNDSIIAAVGDRLGYRDLFFQTESPLGQLGGFSLVTENTLGISLDTLTSGQLTLVYDGSKNSSLDPDNLDPRGLGGVDLTGGGTLDRLELPIIQADLPGISYAITIFSDGDQVSRQVFSTAVRSFSGTIEFLYQDFKSVGRFGAGADFRQVGAIRVDVTSSPESAMSFDTTLGPLRAIPLEMESALGVGLLGLWTFRQWSRCRLPQNGLSKR